MLFVNKPNYVQFIFALKLEVIRFTNGVFKNEKHLLSQNIFIKDVILSHQ